MVPTSFVEIGLVVLEKKSFKGKVDAGRTRDGRTMQSNGKKSKEGNLKHSSPK